MAGKIYITEFDKTGIDANGKEVAAGSYPPVAKQPALSFSGSSVLSAAFGGTTRYIKFHTDAVCSIDIGPNPVADPTYDRISANETQFATVIPGHFLAVIQNV